MTLRSLLHRLACMASEISLMMEDGRGKRARADYINTFPYESPALEGPILLCHTEDFNDNENDNDNYYKGRYAQNLKQKLLFHTEITEITEIL